MTPTPDATRALLRADLVRRRDALAAHTHGPKCAPPGPPPGPACWRRKPAKGSPPGAPPG